MLTLILGRAGTGKTSSIMDEIKRRAESGETGLYLLVPEQYSHDAERRLCAAVGDNLSLHGEVLSFSRLCTRVFSETGGDVKTIDSGGLILLMHRAVEAAAPRLKAFGAKGVRTDFLEKLLAMSKELKSLNITPEKLYEMSGKSTGPLSDKLHDLSLIMGTYGAYFGKDGGDPSDRLTKLAEKITGSSFGNSGAIFFDGFNDFTAQELGVIEKLIRKNAELTVCLTCGDLFGGEEVFELPRKTAAKLTRLAQEYGAEVKTVYPEPVENRAGELRFLEENLFGHGETRYDGECRCIEICAADSKYAECEYAAKRILEMTRAGYRRRDIGVMARDTAEYGPICENVFRKYGIEYFSSGRSDITQKPPVALIGAALDIAAFGFEYKTVFRYLKTGLAGVSAEEYAELENYVLKWNIRGAGWTKSTGFLLPPQGKNEAEIARTLNRLNDLRERIVRPLLKLHKGIRVAESAGGCIRALYDYLEEIDLPGNLEKKAISLQERGQARLAEEYQQLWDIIKNAMEQFNAILGEAPRISATEFRKLFSLVLTQYNVGVIPVSLDRTVLGDMAMSRRRDLKCLIVLGATDDSLPKLTGAGGVLSDSEREELGKLGADMPGTTQERLCRELNIIYSALTQPSGELIITYTNGGNKRPSFIVKRIKEMFNLTEIIPREEDCMSAAPGPCLELAAIAGAANNSPLAFTARKYFELHDFPGAANYIMTADRARGPSGTNLPPELSGKLYGRKITLSPSRLERYYSCPHSYFLQNGLKLYPRETAEFDAPSAGTFTHFILENVSRGIKESGGFKNAREGLCEKLTEQYAEQYIHETLHNFEGKNERFIYLFNRLLEDTKRITQNMADELKSSDFIPLDFELDFAGLKKVPDGLTGIADRVDGFVSGGKLYIRVVDYKSGRKTFELSDILHGRNMQMLIYLFALEKFGEERYGAQIVPAGVLYVPARDFILNVPRNTTDEKLKELRDAELRRGGLILADDDIIEAMENGGTKRFLPVKISKDGKLSGQSLVSAGQLTQLSIHVDKMSAEASAAISGGDIARRPYYKSAADNACAYCDYKAACGFNETAGDKRRFVRRTKADAVWRELGGEDT